MIETRFANLISQAESWQTFRKFHLPSDIIVDYGFLKHTDDFYIELLGKLVELLDSSNFNTNELLSVAKGLQVYSLSETRESITGVDYAANMLYVSGLYYLSGYSASALLLANLFGPKEYSSQIDQFIWSFLARKADIKNEFSIILLKYLQSGDQKIIDGLLNKISEFNEKAFIDSPIEFTSSLLAVSIIRKFSQESIWMSLLEYGSNEHWNDFVQFCLSKRPPVWDFFPSQRTALEAGVIGKTCSVSLQMPTSSGKSALCELIAYDELRRNPESKVLFLAPFRAMASELKNSFAKRLSQLNISSKTIYGGNIPTPEERNAIEQTSLLVATPEKLIAVSNVLSNVTDAFKVVICDEGHLLDDSSRGLRYELLLSKLKKDAIEIGRKFIFISAIIPNIEEINKWLNGTPKSVAISSFRPTDLEYAFLRPGPGKGHFHLDYNPFANRPKKYEIYRFFTPRDFQYLNNFTNRINKYNYNKKSTLTLALALRSLESGAVAVFAPHKKGPSGIESLALELQSMLSAKLPLPSPLQYASPQAISELSDYTSMIFGKNHLLSQLCLLGALYHTGDLPQYVREAFEEEIRNGRIKLVLCTNTLAEGVNLPIRSIVLHSTKRYENNEWRPMSLRNIRNLVGRAGRAGQETSGLVLIPHESDFELIESVIRGTKNEAVPGYLFRVISAITDFVIGKGIKIEENVFENAGESIKEWLDSIDTSIIDLVTEDIAAQGLEDEVKNVISQTFAYLRSNKEQRDTLISILSLRTKKIVPHVEDGSFPRLKRSGLNVREFETLVNHCDFSEPIWEELDNPVNDKWLDLILKLVLSLPTIQRELSILSQKLGKEIDISDLKNALTMWISGEWFRPISKKLQISVDSAVLIVNSFILFEFLIRATGIIRCAEDTLLQSDRTPSAILLSWPVHLQMGLPSTIDVMLAEIGFYDRAGIIALRNLIKAAKLQEIHEVREFIRNNTKDLKNQLQTLIPAISWRATCKAIDYITVIDTF
jgi:superfamily II DNA/RNA helicase